MKKCIMSFLSRDNDMISVFTDSFDEKNGAAAIAKLWDEDRPIPLENIQLEVSSMSRAIYSFPISKIKNVEVTITFSHYKGEIEKQPIGRMSTALSRHNSKVK